MQVNGSYNNPKFKNKSLKLNQVYKFNETGLCNKITSKKKKNPKIKERKIQINAKIIPILRPK